MSDKILVKQKVYGLGDNPEVAQDFEAGELPDEFDIATPDVGGEEILEAC